MLDDMEHKNLFTTTTLFIILFTVFVQGATIKPLVSLLKIRRQAAKNTSMFTEVNTKLLDHVMAGVEEVTGDHGGNYWKQLLFYYNSKYLKKWLQCRSNESSLTRVYTRMILEDHFAHLYGPAAAIEDRKPLLLNKVMADGCEDDEDILEVLPPVSEEQDEDGEELASKPETQLKLRDRAETVPCPRRHSAKFDFQDEEEAKPLRTKRERNSESSAMPKNPPLLKRQTTVTIFSRTSEDDPSRLLQKALHDNPYNKFHQKYNPNLVGEEAQDLALMLRKRRLRARRLTLLALHNKANSSDRRPSADEQTAILSNPTVCTAATFFLERAQKKRLQRRDNVLQSHGPGEASPRLERQCAVARSSDGALSTSTDVFPETVVVRPSTVNLDLRRKSTESEV